MKLKISELDSGFKEKLFKIPTSELVDRGTSFKEKTINLNLTLLKKKNYFVLKGVLNTSPEYICVRCLSINYVQLELPINITISKYLNKKFKINHMNIIFFNDKDTYIECNEIFADLIALAEPMNPLCKPDCNGLCSICGINKKFTCSCKNEINTISQWDKLKEFQI